MDNILICGFTQDDSDTWNSLYPKKSQYFKSISGFLTHPPTLCNLLIGQYDIALSPEWRHRYRQFLDNLNSRGLPFYDTLAELLQPGEVNYMINNGYDNTLRQLYFHHLQDYPEIPRDNNSIISLLPDYRSEHEGAVLIPSVATTLDGLSLLSKTAEYISMAKQCLEYLIQVRSTEVQVIPLHIQERAKNYFSDIGVNQFYPDIIPSQAYSQNTHYSHTLDINISTFMYQYDIMEEHFKAVENNIQKLCLDLMNYKLLNEGCPALNLIKAFSEQNKATISCVFVIEKENSVNLLTDFLEQLMPSALDTVANSIGKDLDFTNLIRTTLFQMKLESQLEPASKGRVTTKI